MSPIQTRLAALLSLAAMASWGCDDVRPPAAATKAATATPTPTGQALPLQALLDDVQAELKAMDTILNARRDAAQALGRMNGSFQSRGYFRRVPTGPALAGLRADLTALAGRVGLRLEQVDARARPPQPAVARALKPGEPWQMTVEELRGIVQLTIDLSGPPQLVADYVNRLPTGVERLVLITGDETLSGGIRLFGEAYYEHPRAPAKVELSWPTLRERLAAAGWSAEDPRLATDPVAPKLRRAIQRGRQQLPDVRSALAVVADFPRWLQRRAFFEDRAMKVAATRGELLLGTTLP